MPQAINDEFTNLPVSKQVKYQLRKMRDGRCRQCGQKATKGPYCAKHTPKRKRAKDEFSDLQVSGQAKYALRKAKKGLCRTCKRPLSTKTFCQYHAAVHRQQALKSYHLRKNINTAGLKKGGSLTVKKFEKFLSQI